MADTFNKDELILDKIRSIVMHDTEDGHMLFRLTSVEEPSLNCTAEGEEITDAIGSTITTLYRAKKATLSGTNSLISLNLASAQYGTEKEVASASNKIVDYTYEIIAIPADATKITLAKTPIKDSIKWIYSIVNNEVGTAYKAGAVASATEFVIGDDGEITLPTGMTGKVYVEYQYEATKAVKVSNKSSNFPKVGDMVVYAYFKDKCNENITYSGKIISPRAKLNPEQIELALTSTGKHPFEFQLMKDYCDELNDELFAIIVAE